MTKITQSSVELVRRKYAMKPRSRHLDDGILNMAQARRYYGVSDSALMRLINAKILVAEQVAPSAPYEIKQAELNKEPVSTKLKTLKKTGKLILEWGNAE